MRTRLPVLRRERRAISRRRTSADRCCRKLRAVSTAWTRISHYAVEFPFLAGVPIRGAGANGGQSWAAVKTHPFPAKRAGPFKKPFPRPVFRAPFSYTAHPAGAEGINGFE